MLWAGAIIGFAGSLHCIGMCGPIVLALPGSAADRFRLIAGGILYNVGRAVTYALLGALIGLVGSSAAAAGYQRWLGIAAGALMIASVLLPQKWIDRALPRLGLSRAIGRLKTGLARLLASGSKASLFAIGFLNGFLPCGLVYAGLAGSIAAGSVAGGAVFMFLFGLGTFPAMFAASFAAGLVTAGLRRRFARLLPYAVSLMGLLFILRGLALGIPYISPKMEKMLAPSGRMTIMKADTLRSMPDSARVKAECCP